MGASASALVNPASPDAVSDPKLREQLDVLLKLTDARLYAYQKELEMMFVDGDSQSSLPFPLPPIYLPLLPLGAAKRSVPGKRALRFSRYVGIDVGNKARYTAAAAEGEEVRPSVVCSVALQISTQDIDSCLAVHWRRRHCLQVLRHPGHRSRQD